MKPTKKPELLTLKKATVPKPEHEQIEEIIASEPIVNPQQFVNVESQATEYLPSYAPLQDYGMTQSAANSGWQPSDIWRELRIDACCD
ncbi:hypothetical protein [Nostoc sp. TCL26-01]|uniref:hypothetical protein n=1 Tax=Nostoc sp. TCL26-01 TaxID=2576904 RepID=UPI0015BCF907|nr:hypothetical protein [Nostoc sp. TCL26-01]QLE59606.1 hypothetical protein FD725_29540 [Nostoc sp. TCL26-01]